MRLIDADYLIKEFTDRAQAARDWKENALNSGNEESAIRADAILSFLAEVKLTIDNAPTLPNPCGNPCNFISSKDDLIKAFELLKAYCKNRECNKDCVFYRELRIGDNIDHQYCGLCEIVASDDEEEAEDE